ncbi:MAG: hypothetical protein ACTSRZ_17025 [Promethearchaeota archaeon]
MKYRILLNFASKKNAYTVATKVKSKKRYNLKLILILNKMTDELNHEKYGENKKFKTKQTYLVHWWIK